MKKTVIFTIIFVAVVSIITPAMAFEISGEVWSVTHQEHIPNGKISMMNRVKVSPLKIGPLQLIGELDYAGSLTNINEFIDLISDSLDEEELEDLDDFYILGGLSGGAQVNWPLLYGIQAVGTVGYRVSGNVFKDEGSSPNINSGLYGGITYGGGLGVELVDGLQLTGIFEYGSDWKNLVGDQDSGSLTSLDINLEYQIPIVLAKVGYRVQNLKLDNAPGHRISGFYVGAGIHF